MNTEDRLNFLSAPLSTANDENEVNLHNLIATNPAFKENCQLLADILIYGSRDMRMAFVVSLAMFNDAAGGNSNVLDSSFSSATPEEVEARTR